MIDTRELVSQLRVIESIAYLPRVTSTNTVGRRILDECMANDIALPSAMIIAGEQTEGRGRGTRGWHSPPGAGIYVTALHTRKPEELSTLPLEIGVIVARFLQSEYSLDARIKWPNDILVDGKKIAGILIEARTGNSAAYTAIGTGINVAPVSGELATAATSITESLRGRIVKLDPAIAAFVRAFDAGLARRGNPVADWIELAVHRHGDSVSFRLGSREIRGLWEGIDPYGRALVREAGVRLEISAAELFLVE